MKSYSLAIRLVICTLVIFLSAAKLRAQIDRSTISGTVTDPSGAVVPGATVVVTNTATSESVTLTTVADGSYTAQAWHSGFEKPLVRNFTVKDGNATLNFEFDAAAAD